MDLYIAKFDGETFSVPDKLKTTSGGETSDSNSIYEVMYGVGVQNNKLHYAWVENSENSYFYLREQIKFTGCQMAVLRN